MPDSSGLIYEISPQLNSKVADVTVATITRRKSPMEWGRSSGSRCLLPPAEDAMRSSSVCMRIQVDPHELGRAIIGLAYTASRLAYKCAHFSCLRRGPSRGYSVVRRSDRCS